MSVVESLSSPIDLLKGQFPIPLVVAEDVPYPDTVIGDFMERFGDGKALPLKYQKGVRFCVLGVAVSIDGPHEYLVQFEEEDYPEYVRELPPHE